MDSHFENPSGSPGDHYSRWPDPWRREDDWGPITAAVMFFIILAGLIVYGSGAHLIDRYARGSSGRPDGCIERGASRLRLSDSHGEARAWGHSISTSGARC
jgi:hypothetical protein